MTPIVAAHGIGNHSGFFAHQANGLAPRALIGFDMPGFGAEPVEETTTFEGLARSLRAKAEAAGAPVHVMGHSMGGMVALELAATVPDVVRSLILCNTTSAFGGKDDSFKTAFVSARLAPLEAGETMASMAPKSMRSTCGSDVSDAVVDFLADLMAETPEAAYRAAINCLVTFDRRDALVDLDVPVLLIGGEEDQAAPARTMQRMAEKIAGAECHILPGGHMTPVERAGEVNALIADFLARVEAS